MPTDSTPPTGPTHDGPTQDGPTQDRTTPPQHVVRQAVVDTAGADWTVAHDRPVSNAELRRRLGARPPVGTLAVREAGAAAKAAAGGAGAAAAPPRPAAFNWHSSPTGNYVTPVRDQGDCGSCVAFGTAATIESTAKIRFGATLSTNLSEAHLFYCIGRKSGATCADGWWPDAALDGAGVPGVTDEPHFPYTAGDQSCGVLPGWADKVTKVTDWHTIDDVEQMKQWIATKGPLTTCFTVYEDFYDYAGGTYRHVYGGEEGGHCVSVIGYHDPGGYWVAKNSWNTWFGIQGYFRIAYGQCGFDFEMYAVDSVIVPSPGTEPLYRYYNHATADHAYTSAWTEFGNGSNGYTFEGTQCYLFTTRKTAMVPFYRFFNAAKSDHVYSIHRDEFAQPGDGYVYQGVVGQVYAARQPRSLPLYRYWNATKHDHLFTNSRAEGDAAAGYVLQKTACYVPAGPA